MNLWRWLLFPRYMLAFCLFMLGMKLFGAASKVSAEFDRELGRLVRYKEMGLDLKKFEANPEAKP